MSGKIRIFTLLRPFGFIYGIITAIRNLMYNCGVLKSHTYRVPVISIGNITVGGTGKTPHTEYITPAASEFAPSRSPYWGRPRTCRSWRRRTGR